MQLPQQSDGGQGDRAGAVDEGGEPGVWRPLENPAQGDARRIREDRHVVADVVGNREELALVSAEALGMRAARVGAVAEMQRRRDRSAREVATRRVAALRASRAWRVDA